MMKYKISVFVGYLLLAATIAQNNDTKNSIGFPEIEEDLPSKNKDVSSVFPFLVKRFKQINDSLTLSKIA